MPRIHTKRENGMDTDNTTTAASWPARPSPPYPNASRCCSVFVPSFLLLLNPVIAVDTDFAGQNESKIYKCIQHEVYKQDNTKDHDIHTIGTAHAALHYP